MTTKTLLGLFALSFFFFARPATAFHVADWNSDGAIVIGCLGDSNSFQWVPPPTTWCLRLGDLVASRGWITKNYGIPGATVVEPNPLAPSFTSTAQQQLTIALGQNQPPDVFVLAFGTNDLRGGATVAEVVDAYASVRQEIESGGRRAVIALTPPLCTPDQATIQPLIDSLNADLQSTFTDQDDLVDFASIMDLDTDYSDCLHMNDAGHQKRADAAFAQLTVPPFFVQDVREVCQFPKNDNDGNVVGHDNGSSVLFGGTSYWFFADTILDRNHNGFQDADDTSLPGGFIGLGTVAATTDLDASDCIEMSYSNTAGTAKTVYPASALLADECLLWPAAPVVANNQIYLYGTAVIKVGGQCALGNPTRKFVSTFNTGTMQATRIATTQEGNEPGFGTPFVVSEPDGCGGMLKWIYLVGTKPMPSIPDVNWPVTGYLLARVPESQIADPTKYQYWNGSTWIVDDPTAAEPLFSEVFAANNGGITYNEHLGRYMLTYTCNVTSSVCARTAATPGRGPAALVASWSERVVLYTCPGEFFNCYLGYQHPEYGDGSTIYVTSSRLTPHPSTCANHADCYCAEDNSFPFPRCENIVNGQGICVTPEPERYRLRLREVQIGSTPPPEGRVFADAGRDYTPKQSYPSQPGAMCSNAVQGANGWTYESLSESTLTQLTYDYLWQWRGFDSVSGFPAPLINEDTYFPGNNTDAVRVWQAPGAGTVRISGEARKKQLCGDQTIAAIIRIQDGSPIGDPLWSATFDANNRTALLDVTTSVEDGDKIGIKVKRGGASAACDEVILAPTITYTP